MIRVVGITILVHECSNFDKQSGANESAKSVHGNDDGYNKLNRLKTDIFFSKSRAISIN